MDLKKLNLVPVIFLPPSPSFFPGKRLPHHLRDDGDAFADGGFVHGEGDAEALAGVEPGLGFAAEEEVVAGDDEDLAVLE